MRPALTSPLSSILASALLWGIPLGSAEAQHALSPAPVANKVEFKDPTNAALVYYQIWMRSEYTAIKGPARDQLQASDPLWQPNPALTTLLVEKSDLIDQILRASRIPHADFGVEFSQGIKALLPNLAEMRNIARVLACDARRLTAAGDLDGAAERVAAIYRVADHLSGAPVLISALVSVAVCSVADSQTRVLLTDGRLTPRGKEIVLVAARRMAKPDAFGVKRGVTAERWWSTDALRKLAIGPDAGQKIVSEVAPLMDIKNDSDQAKAIRAMDERAIHAEFDRAAAAYGEMIASWDQPDAQQRLAQLEQHVASGGRGIMAAILVPALSKAHQSDTKARVEHAEVVARLEKYVPLTR